MREWTLGNLDNDGWGDFIVEGPALALNERVTVHEGSAARVKELEAALREIADVPNEHWTRKIARAALKQEQDG